MENLNGIKLQIHDMKRDGNDLLYFKQLQDSIKKTNDSHSQNGILNENLFKKYDYLLITSEDELLGIKNEESEIILKVKDAYKLAQGMFVSG